LAELRSISSPFAVLLLKTVTVLIAVVMGCGMLTGCADGVPSSTTATSGPIATTSPGTTPAPESGTLRVWATPFTTRPDPLRDPDRTHQAVYRLVYEGLFSLTENQSAEPVLCDEWEMSGNGFYLTVHVAVTERFHDGARLDALDVKASFDAVKESPDSPHHELLSNVETAVVLDENTIRFGFTVPDRFALHCLTFPVVPAEAAVSATGRGDPPPGTGPYRMAWLDDSPDALLERTGSAGSANDALIPSLRVVTFPDIRSAVEALEEDRVDLVDLNADEFRLYSNRQDLAVYHYSGSGYLFFVINAKSGRVLSDANRYWYTRSRLDRIRETAGTDLTSLTAAAMPAVPLSQVLSGQDSVAETPGDYPKPPDGDSGFPQQPLTLLYPSEDPVRAAVADRTETILREAGIPVSKLPVSDPVFLSRLATQSYDIAICEATTGRVPDPGWLYLQDGVRTLPGMESLPVATSDPESYEAAIQTLRSHLSSFSSEGEWNEVRDALVACAQVAPMVGIGFVRQGLMAGHRVKGQFSSLRDNPYHGIEEVWVWSGS